jgi:glycosyltransferase involved in cell wall biosynthesis
MKLPVITSKHSGTQDAVEQDINGLLVEPTDSKDIINAVELLITDSNTYARISENGYTRARSMFSWTVTARKYNKLLKSYSKSDI